LLKSLWIGTHKKPKDCRTDQILDCYFRPRLRLLASYDRKDRIGKRAPFIVAVTREQPDAELAHKLAEKRNALIVRPTYVA